MQFHFQNHISFRSVCFFLFHAVSFYDESFSCFVFQLTLYAVFSDYILSSVANSLSLVCSSAFVVSNSVFPSFSECSASVFINIFYFANCFSFIISITPLHRCRCQSCPVGTFSTTLGASPCVACSPGSYTNTAVGSSSCTQCPSGRYVSAAGSGPCVQCTAGKYSTTGASACGECLAGA